MHVVLLVTGIAICRQGDLGHLLGHVTGLTNEAAMLAGERVARLHVVIEAPQRPTIGGVAERTVGRQAPLVMVILVAGRARERRIFVPPREMALLACDDRVAADQWKSREVVIEGRDPAPVVFAVALFSVPFLYWAGQWVRAALGAGWVATAVGGVVAGRSPRTSSR